MNSCIESRKRPLTNYAVINNLLLDGASLFYTSIHHPHTFADLRQYLLHRLLTPSTLSNPTTPSSFPFKKRAQVVERDQVMVPAGWDSFGKIKVLRNGFDCEGVAQGWELDEQTRELPSSEGAESNGGNPAGARFVYEDVITNPKLNHAVSVLLHLPLHYHPIATLPNTHITH